MSAQQTEHTYAVGTEVMLSPNATCHNADAFQGRAFTVVEHLAGGFYRLDRFLGAKDSDLVAFIPTCVGVGSACELPATCSHDLGGYEMPLCSSCSERLQETL